VSAETRFSRATDPSPASGTLSLASFSGTATGDLRRGPGTSSLSAKYAGIRWWCERDAGSLTATAFAKRHAISVFLRGIGCTRCLPETDF
jgi:hypothetical protein